MYNPQRDCRYDDGRKVTRLSVALNLLLGASKCLAGYFGNSRALLADGLHSLTDLASDFAVLIGMRLASTPPDENHPYGHERAASLVTLFIAASLMALCSLLVVDSVRALHGGDAVVPHWPTLVIALGSVGVKEFLFQITRRAGRKAGSSMLIANAWHHRTDSLTSIVAAIGIGLAMVLGEGWAFIDALVGVLLGVYLGVEGAKLLWGAVKDLMDAAPDREIIDDLREHILGVPGAVAYHDFRARRVGDSIDVDLHLQVNATMTIAEAHEVARAVKRAIMAAHPEVVSVLVHTEPALPEHAKDRGIAEGAEQVQEN